MRVGAFDYITKPVNIDHVEAAVRRALSHHTLLEDKRRYENHLERWFGSGLLNLSTWLTTIANCSSEPYALRRSMQRSNPAVKGKWISGRHGDPGIAGSV